MTTTGGGGYGTRFSAAWSGNLDSPTASAGNFAILRLTAIPEPGTASLAVAGMALLAARRSRRA